MTLSAAPSASSDFTGWIGGGCTGTGPCAVTMSAAMTVRADFTLKTWQLSVSTNGNGAVTSTPAGINCGGQCTKTYDHGTMVTLSAAGVPNYMLGMWTGACSGNGACVVNMDQARTVGAVFIPQSVGVSVSKSGNGVATVTSSPAGINCGSTCFSSFPIGTVVTLTAMTDPSSDFLGWSGGGCSGTGTCVITVAGATSIFPSFALKTYALNVGLAGLGSGSVTSTPAGINCGTVCSKSFDHGTMVSLTANTATGSTFFGWSGACSGTGACTVDMTQARSVTATFTQNAYPLSITKTGNGGGTVTSAPAGISCGLSCVGTFNHNTVVTLTAAPTAGSTFLGWTGGGCSGTGTCVVTVTQSQSISAAFEYNPLSVTTGGNGFGVISSSPAGITNCGGVGASSCSATYTTGASVTLTAVADASPLARLSTFVGWSSPCSGTGTCVVTMNGPVTVTAVFALKPNIAFVTANSTTGNIGGKAGADMMCQTAASAGGLSGTYLAWISTSAFNAIGRLSGASGWVRVDGKPLANTPAEIAAGKLYYPLRIDNLNGDVGEVSTLTGTNLAGAHSGNSCNDFTLAGGNGSAGRTSGLGAISNSYGTVGCAGSSRIYCFGVDRPAAVTIVPPTLKRLAFTTNASWTPGGGIGSADTLCQSEAQSAGLPGTYLALLATTLQSAAARFDITKPVWTRVDGVPLAATAAATFSGTVIDTAPNLNAAGTAFFDNYGIWGGATTLNTAGNSALTCSNWSTTVGAGGGGGVAGQTTVAAFFLGFGNNPCGANYIKLVCLQQ